MHNIHHVFINDGTYYGLDRQFVTDYTSWYRIQSSHSFISILALKYHCTGIRRSQTKNRIDTKILQRHRTMSESDPRYPSLYRKKSRLG